MKVEGQEFAPDKAVEVAIAALLGAEHWLLVVGGETSEKKMHYNVMSSSGMTRSHLIKVADVYDTWTLEPDELPDIGDDPQEEEGA